MWAEIVVILLDTAVKLAEYLLRQSRRAYYLQMERPVSPWRFVLWGN